MKTANFNFRIVLLFVLWLIGSYSTIAQIKTEFVLPDSNIVFKTTDVEGVIFSKKFRIRPSHDNQSIEIDPIKFVVKDSCARRYAPTINEVLEIEPRLKIFILDSNRFISDSLHSYVKQYFGYITSAKDTIIYINCFLDADIKLDGYWKSRFVHVFDGWFLYFNVKYNVTRKRFFDLGINGVG